MSEGQPAALPPAQQRSGLCLFAVLPFLLDSEFVEDRGWDLTPEAHNGCGGTAGFVPWGHTQNTG